MPPSPDIEKWTLPVSHMNVSALQFGFDIVVDFVGMGPEDDRVESWM